MSAESYDTRREAPVGGMPARPPDPAGKPRGRFPWPWRQEGRHFKLMLAVGIAVLLAIPFLVRHSIYWAAAALLLWLLTLAVQWLCIEPPGVEEKDLH